MIDHATLKTIHVGCVILSISGFTLRGIWMLTDSSLLHARWVRVAPHVVDTLLLLTGIWLAINLQQYPGTSTWLTAKLLALLAYIGLGTVALKRGKTRAIRIGALFAAWLVFAYMVLVAVSRAALPL